MKSTFLFRLFAAIAEAVGGNTVAPELTSQALTALKATRKAAWAEMLKHEDPDTAEALAAKQAVWKIDGEIAAEKQNLQKAVSDAKVAELRKERLQLNENQFVTYDALKAILADKKATPEAIAEKQNAFDTAKELVNNELLSKFGKAATVKKADGEATEGSKSEAKAAILAAYVAGRTHAQIESDGIAPRSTVWHVIDKAIKTGEVTKMH